MKLIDLTMPIWEGAGYGEWGPFNNVPVVFHEYGTYANQGFRLTQMKLDGQTGSPFMTPREGAPFRTVAPKNAAYPWTLDEIPLERLLLRNTVVVNIPATDYHEITGKEMEEALARASYEQGDEVLVSTGWATTEKAYALGAEYVVRSPSFSNDAGVVLAAKMKAMKSTLLFTDCGHITPPRLRAHSWSVGEKPILPLPKPWPSAEARERKMDQREGLLPDPPERSSDHNFLPVTLARVKCILNSCLITQSRVQVIVLPLLIKECGATPCRIFALES